MSEFDRRFRYRARDHAGQERRGLVDAADLPSAIQALQAKQLVALEVAAVDGAPDGRVMSRRKRRMRDAERIVLLQEMATLLEAGVSAAEALPSMAEAHAAQASGPALAAVRDAVNAGRPLAESLRAAPVIGLPPYALALIEAGEASGTLARAIHSAAEQLEHDRRVAEEMRSALIYPTVLVVVGTLVILTIFIGVVPRFATLISNPRADIPEFSRQVIASAVYVKQHLTAFALGAGAILALLVASFTGATGRERLVALALRVPGLRPWMLESDLGRWAGVLGALLGSRVPVIRAIGLSAAAVRVPAMAGDVSRLAGELERGRTLADALREHPWFPASRINLVRVGERSGELPKALATLGAMHTDAARTRQRRILALVEPAAILVIAFVVGLVMVAVMSAITSVNSLAG